MLQSLLDVPFLASVVHTSVACIFLDAVSSEPFLKAYFIYISYYEYDPLPK